MTVEVHKQKVDDSVQAHRKIKQRNVSPALGISKERVRHLKIKMTKCQTSSASARLYGGFLLKTNDFTRTALKRVGGNTSTCKGVMLKNNKTRKTQFK